MVFCRAGRARGYAGISWGPESEAGYRERLLRWGRGGGESGLRTAATSTTITAAAAAGELVG